MWKWHDKHPENRDTHIMVMRGEDLVGYNGPIVVHLCYQWEYRLAGEGHDRLRDLKLRLGKDKVKIVRHE